MNVNQIINMITRIFMRKVVNRGLDAGIDYASRRGRAKEDLTADEQKRAREGKQMARKARQGAKLMRRIGRM